MMKKKKSTHSKEKSFKSKGKNLSLPKDKSMTKLELLGELTRLRKRMVKFENLDLIADSKMSDKRQRELEEASRMATVVRDSNDAITIQDYEGRITAWNRGAEKMFGYSEEEALQMTIWQLAPPNKAAEQKDFNRRIFAGEKVASFETQRLTKDGRLLDIWLVVTKLVDAEGKVIGIASTERDITARQRELEEASRMVTVVRDSNDAITIQDFEGRITAWNRGAELMFGYSEEEALQMTIWQLAPPNKAAEQKDFNRRIFAGEKVSSFETQRLTKDGRLLDVWLTVTKLLDDKGKVIGIASTERDITARKRAEEALRSASVYNRNLIEASLDPLVMISPEGKITDVNRETELVTGCGREELVGTDFSDYFTEPERARAGYRQVFQDGVVRDYVLEIRHRDGRVTPVLYSASVYRDEAGKVKGVFAAARDISERKRAEALLKETLEDLKHSNTELEQFAFVTSHDLQEPLRMVASYMQLIEKRYKGKLDADADEFIGYAVDGAVRMKTMINDLLNFSRLGTKGKEAASTDCQLILSTVLTNLSMVIEETKSEITSDPLPLVKGDEAQLVRLFQNLIDNAIKFRGGDAPRIHISCKPQNGSYLFSIRDNGIGIDPRYFDRIFIIFQRLHGTEQYPGTGIGLAMCKKIVDRHRGKIWIESEPGKGTTFYFTLPGA